MHCILISFSTPLDVLSPPIPYFSQFISFVFYKLLIYWAKNKLSRFSIIIFNEMLIKFLYLYFCYSKLYHTLIYKYKPKITIYSYLYLILLALVALNTNSCFYLKRVSLCLQKRI